MTELLRDQIVESLRRFKRLRDALLHEDVSQLEHHLERIVTFCESDPFVTQVLEPILNSSNFDSATWWNELAEAAESHRGVEVLKFPDNPDDETALRFLIMKDIVAGNQTLLRFGSNIWIYKLPAIKESFLSLIARPFFEELSDRLGEAAGIASSEIRALQAIPFDRIPGANETKIFLSHKSTDKPLVERFYRALTELGFQPWLDNPAMPAGSNLERSIRKGFEESCAAVFFITENFVDGNYLATEVDYAIIQKRKKGDKFAIITLVFSENYIIPGLLEPFVYKVVQSELDGLYELIRALPVELGPIRWKETVVLHGQSNQRNGHH